MQDTGLTIAVETPLSDDMRCMIGELNETLIELSPQEDCYHMTPEEMARPNTTVFVARIDQIAAACGALCRHADGIGEVKRMYTRASHQGLGIGADILDRIVAVARKEGLSSLVLETGDRHPAAWRIYEKAGFSRCGPVLDYPDSPFSIFYQKPLQAEDKTQS